MYDAYCTYVDDKSFDNHDYGDDTDADTDNDTGDDTDDDIKYAYYSMVCQGLPFDSSNGPLHRFLVTGF